MIDHRPGQPHRCPQAVQGFEWRPEVPTLADVIYGDGPVQCTREFAEADGYGVCTCCAKATSARRVALRSHGRR